MDRERNRRVERTVVGVVLATVLGASVGCSRTLFREGDVRTQYTRYDQARGEHAPMFVVDEFGARTPNLRGRLGGQSVTP